MLLGVEAFQCSWLFQQLACVHSPAIELDNEIRFRLWSGCLQEVSGTYSTATNSPAISVINSLKTC